MKILFVYFSKKQMCETAEQAIGFINGLKYRNQEHQIGICVNEHTERMLQDAYRTEWQTNEYGRPYLVLEGRPRYGCLEIATTGCRDTRIYGYKALGDTVEEHDAAVAADADAQRLKKDAILKAKQENRMLELSVVRRGWYHVELDFCVMVFRSSGNNYMAESTFSGDIIAASGMDAYNKAVQHILSGPAEIVNYRGNMSSLHSWAEMDSNGYSFTFLGVKTEDGYSIEKWEEWKEKGEI